MVIAHSQTRAPVTLTAAELREQVRRARAGLRRLGVGRGDRVAAYAPNIPETFVLMLATASLGAIFSSCAPEFGTRSVIDRWQQIEPKVLVAVDGYRYGDKAVDRRAEVAAIRAALPSRAAHQVDIGYLDPDRRHAGATWPPTPTSRSTFDAVPFDHPLYVLYSSGTTGLPKPIVHGHGGILLEHLKMLALHHDLGPADRFFWFTTTGWMMWNFLVSGAGGGRGDRAVRRQPRRARPRRAVAAGRGGRHHLLRHVRAVPAGLPQGRPRAAARSPTCPRCAGSARPARRCRRRASAGSTSTSAPTCSSSRCPAAPTCAPASSAAAPLLPVHAGEIACRCLGAKVEAFDSATARRWSASSASW